MPVIDLLSTNDDSVRIAIAGRAVEDVRAVPLVEKLIALVNELERQLAGDVFATVSDCPLSLMILSGKGITATVWVDYFDRRPAAAGWPELHYRAQFKTEDAALSEEFRSDVVGEVAGKIIGRLELR